MPSRKALLAVAIAFGAGLLLFLALWLDIRDSNDFYRTDEAPRSVEGQVFTPLPAPLPAGDEGHFGDVADEDAASPPAQAPAPSSTPPPASPVPPPAAPAAAATIDSAPRLLNSPAPRYPREAQRRGVTGTVMLRVHVGSDGSAEAIDVVQGSGSRDLDRAAVEAVHRWRFAPAMRGGQPVAAAVQVPITFNLK
jgi:protein TonB